MPRVTATLTLPISRAGVYQYLRKRYDSELYRTVSLAAKGYVPPITCLEAVEDVKLCFRVPGRDVLFGIPMGSWKWCYELESLSDSETRVTIWYEWSLLVTFLSAWTVKHQAANELVETALALKALTRSKA